jgi:hypothetical protein
LKLKIISCEVFAREFCRIIADSEHICDVTFLSFGLHDTPEKLREAIQQSIDSVEPGAYDYIVLGYGLCSRGTADIKAGHTPVVIPRAHDCITLFLGSRKRYNQQFINNPGTYYYSPGWIERKDGDVQQGTIVEVKSHAYEEKFKEYAEKYGEENAQFLIEQESQWFDHYSRAAYIHTGVGTVERYRDFTRGVAESHGWDYEEIEGDMNLIEKLLAGDWTDEDFLVVKPGQRTKDELSAEIITAE